MPLAPSFRSSAKVVKGSVVYENFSWHSNVQLPPDQIRNLDEACRRMSSMTVSATGGTIGRDGQSRIRARLDWVFPNEDLRKFAQDKIGEMEYVSLETTISTDSSNPTVFHVVGRVDVEAGDTLFDIVAWKTKIAGIDGIMKYSGQATGFLENDVFQGTAEARYEMIFPQLPGLQILQIGYGKFHFTVAR
jgi:hypothetical protein